MLDNMGLAACSLKIAFLFVCVCEDESCLFFFFFKQEGCHVWKSLSVSRYSDIVVVIKLNWAYAEQ